MRNRLSVAGECPIQKKVDYYVDFISHPSIDDK